MSAEILFEHKLKRGTVTVSHEQKGDDEALNFAAVIETDHPAKTVFEQVVLGFVDSEKSWIWPIEYENVPKPLDFELYEGCQFSMIYRVPRWDDPKKTMPGVTYTYFLKQYKPDEYLFQYESIDHPLRGGGTFRAIPTGEGTSRFDWRGSYVPSAGADKVIVSLRRYLPVLYEVFERNIEAGPRELA